MLKIFSFILCSLILGSCTTSENFSEPKVYPHNTDCFTQGLEYYEGYIYESCGLYGHSYVAKYKLGEQYEKKVKGAEKYFYEGLTIFDEKIYVLTWKSRDILVFNLELELLETKKLPYLIGEGWGLASDQNSFYISNGTETIFITNPNFEIENTLSTGRKNLNELEYKDRKLYANIWKQPTILEIDASNWQLLQTHDFSKYQETYSGEQVLNGISFIGDKKLITGKNWKELILYGKQ